MFKIGFWKLLHGAVQQEYNSAPNIGCFAWLSTIMVRLSFCRCAVHWCSFINNFSLSPSLKHLLHGWQRTNLGRHHGSFIIPTLTDGDRVGSKLPVYYPSPLRVCKNPLTGNLRLRSAVILAKASHSGSFMYDIWKSFGIVCQSSPNLLSVYKCVFQFGVSVDVLLFRDHS